MFFSSPTEKDATSHVYANGLLNLITCGKVSVEEVVTCLCIKVETLEAVLVDSAAQLKCMCVQNKEMDDEDIDTRGAASERTVASVGGQP